MRDEDSVAISRLVHRSPIDPMTVLLLSGSDEEERIMRERWPSVGIVTLSEADWDLRFISNRSFERPTIAVACNTFMCAADPQLWLHNMADCCDWLLIQDLADCKRESGRHLSPDTGDVMRYSVSSHGVIGRTDEGHTVFDISAAGYHVMDCVPYRIDGGAGLKFAVLLDLRNHV